VEEEPFAARVLDIRPVRARGEEVERIARRGDVVKVSVFDFQIKT
jgi:hypothetical protein